MNGIHFSRLNLKTCGSADPIFAALQDVWHRTQDGVFDIPESPDLTPECRELLQQMLQPDISARISISGIMLHPWFLQDLPDGAVDMNDKYLSQPRACEQTEADILTIIKQARGL